MSKIKTLTPEECEAIRAFIENDDPSVLETDAGKILTSLAAAYSSKLQETAHKSLRKNAMLQRRLDRISSRQEHKVIEGTAEETGLDSLEVGLALLYCLQQLDCKGLTKNKLILILYGMYCSWLYSKKQRLFLEHPVANEWGPQLWRVYKRIENIRTPVEYNQFSSLAERNPGVASFCRNSAAKYHDIEEKDLKASFTGSEPYRKAKLSKGGKWGGEISDADILEWKTKQNTK